MNRREKINEIIRFRFTVEAWKMSGHQFGEMPMPETQKTV
jgi:hypothetical protein